MLKTNGALTQDYRFALKEAFALTAAMIRRLLIMSGVIGEGPTPPEYLSAYEKVMDLRYGENPIKRQLFIKRNWQGSRHGGIKTTTHGKGIIL